jgi:hypothetical protein
MDVQKNVCIKINVCRRKLGKQECDELKVRSMTRGWGPKEDEIGRGRRARKFFSFLFFFFKSQCALADFLSQVTVAFSVQGLV